MVINAIREATRAQTFQPFRLADGREVLIPHPDFIAVAPGGRRVIVFHQDETMSILEPLLIVSLEFPAPNAQVSGNANTNGAYRGVSDNCVI
jgi:hypothetical protein